MACGSWVLAQLEVDDTEVQIVLVIGIRGNDSEDTESTSLTFANTEIW